VEFNGYSFNLSAIREMLIFVQSTENIGHRCLKILKEIYEGLDELMSMKLRKIIICVPHYSIGSAFACDTIEYPATISL
jgi:hypothetical protein